MKDKMFPPDLGQSFCSYCGTRLVKDDRPYRYSTGTGEAIYGEHCPNRRRGWRRYFAEDRHD